MGKLAIIFKLQGTVIDISIGFIGIPLVNQRLHQFDDLLHVLRCFGMNGCVMHSKAMGICEILPDVFLGNLLRRNSLFIGALDNLIIHIGEILHKSHFVPPVLQVAP